VTERFADEALDAVADDGTSGRAAGDGHAEARAAAVVQMREHGEVLVDAPGGTAENACKIGAGSKAGFAVEPAAAGASVGPGGTAVGSQGVRRARPFARRRFSTCRPALVAMRARKPWARFFLILLGW